MIRRARWTSMLCAALVAGCGRLAPVPGAAGTITPRSADATPPVGSASPAYPGSPPTLATAKPYGDGVTPTTIVDSRGIFELHVPAGWFVGDGRALSLTSYDVGTLMGNVGFEPGMSKIEAYAEPSNPSEPLDAVVDRRLASTDGMFDPSERRVLWRTSLDLRGGVPAVRLDVEDPAGVTAWLVARIGAYDVTLHGYGDLEPFDEVALELVAAPGSSDEVEPSATPTPPPLAFALADPLPLAVLSGRVLWVESREAEGRSVAAVRSMDLATGAHQTLWEYDVSAWYWAVAPATNRAAYVTERDGRAALVVRDLSPGTDARVVALADVGMRMGQPTWHPDGRSLAYAVVGRACYDGVEDSPCSYRIVDADTGVDQTLWTGPRTAFPFACDCDRNWYWEPASARVALFEHPFESTHSQELSVVQSGHEPVIQRQELLIESRARAQSADGIWIALLDSPSYYGSSIPVSRARYASPERWPGEARVRLLNIQTGGILDLGGWETAVGFTSPIWSPDGAWIAFAEPTGTLVGPLPAPRPTPAAYPAPSPSPSTRSMSRQRYEATGAIVWVMSPEGTIFARIEMDQPDALPVAASPDGTQILVARYATDGRSADLYVYRVTDGAGGRLATMPGRPTEFAWLP